MLNNGFKQIATHFLGQTLKKKILQNYQTVVGVLSSSTWLTAELTKKKGRDNCLAKKTKNKHRMWEFKPNL